MPVSNEEAAQLFENMAVLLELQGDSIFKIRAYQRAARTIENLSFSLAQAVDDGVDLKAIPGVGKAISDKVRELHRTGTVAAYEKLRAEVPDGVLDLMGIPGVGPKTAALVSRELGVTNVAELEAAIRDGRVASLPRMGKKASEALLRHIQSQANRDKRTPIGQALALAEEIGAALQERCGGIAHLVAAGSLRRWEETIGDVDLICVSDNPESVGSALTSLPQVRETLVHGPSKTSVVVEPGIQVDLRAGESDALGAMLQYFTGSQQHNLRLRDYANHLGLSLNEYGITDLKTGIVERFATEDEFYGRLGLPYIPPELRLGLWELDAAREERLPRLVEAGDLRGDLHLHSDWSDGEDPIEVMVQAAVDQGYEYMALTDHSSGLGIANGLSNERIRQQMDLLRSLQDRYPITILCGSEVDIRADGSLDYPDEILERLDVVVASVHSAMGQDSKTMTQRIIKVMQHPSVTIIGHLSTRLLGHRDPVQFDVEEVLQAARETGTALEINAAPERLDLKDTHAYRAREIGVPLVINTDSHHRSNMANRRFGVSVARRAWCESRHIVNTWPREQFLRFLNTPKSHRTAVLDETLLTMDRP